MRRRTVVSAFLVGGGAVAGHLFTAGLYRGQPKYQTPAEFAAAVAGVRLDFLSKEMMLKIYTQTVTDADRLQLTREVINHNWPLFVVEVPDRRYGFPGLYRLVE